MSNKNFKRPNNNGQNNGQKAFNAALAKNFAPENTPVGEFEQPPVVRYGGKAKTTIYEYDITSRAIEDAIKDLFSTVDPDISRNLVVMSAAVNKRLFTVTVMFDPKTVTVGRKKNNKGSGTLVQMFEENNDDDTRGNRVQLRRDVADLLSMLTYNKKERDMMRNPESLKLFGTSDHQMRKFLMGTVPFRYSVSNREMVAIHIDPIKVFHYMLRDVRNADTTKRVDYSVVIRNVKLPSNDGEAIFTVDRRRTTRRRANSDIDETIRRQMASTLTKRFTSGI
nr:MAG TPA: hypothetical protein [Caudoviricetes sp.]